MNDAVGYAFSRGGVGETDLTIRCKLSESRSALRLVIAALYRSMAVEIGPEVGEGITVESLPHDDGTLPTQ